MRAPFIEVIHVSAGNAECSRQYKRSFHATAGSFGMHRMQAPQLFDEEEQAE
jgi:hypothetical protein